MSLFACQGWVDIFVVCTRTIGIQYVSHLSCPGLVLLSLQINHDDRLSVNKALYTMMVLIGGTFSLIGQNTYSFQHRSRLKQD